MTPLMVCASLGQIECFNVIMDLNPDVMKLDSTGKTALHYAARAGNLNVLRELCQNEDVDVDLQSSGGMTPLMLAVESGNANAVAECLNNSCNPFVINGIGEKAIDLAKKFEFSG